MLNSNILGSPLSLPYYQVISENKDFTFRPRIFDSDIKMFQNEYRQKNKNSSPKKINEKDLNITKLINSNEILTKQTKDLEESIKINMTMHNYFIVNDNHRLIEKLFRKRIKRCKKNPQQNANSPLLYLCKFNPSLYDAFHKRSA